MSLRTLASATILLSATAFAHASFLTGSFAVTVTEGNTAGASFDTTNGVPSFTGSTAGATFTYTGAIDFQSTGSQNSNSSGDLNSTFGFTASNISGYSGHGTVAAPSNADYTSVASFLASSGSASGFQYGSYYTFDLGVLSAGTVLTITHDDGVSLFQGATQIGSTVSGPTVQTTDVVDITQTGDTVLRYARENGTPSILEVTATTPEPSSIALLGTGIFSMAAVLRKRLA